MPDEPDDQSQAEAVDEDMIDGEDFPPDRPLGLDEELRDITVPGDEAIDSLADRIARENPDLTPAPRGDLDLREGLIEDDTDLEGELGEPDRDFALSDSAGIDRDDRPAEERAMHVEGADPDDTTLTEILDENEQRYR